MPVLTTLEEYEALPEDVRAEVLHILLTKQGIQ